MVTVPELQLNPVDIAPYFYHLVQQLYLPFSNGKLVKI
jgi:hypothetical protein